MASLLRPNIVHIFCGTSILFIIFLAILIIKNYKVVSNDCIPNMETNQKKVFESYDYKEVVLPMNLEDPLSEHFREFHSEKDSISENERKVI